MSDDSGSLKPLLVLVSGAPGSGKTTLAERIARRVGVPHLNRDSFYAGVALTEGKAPTADRNAEAFYGAVAQMLGSRVSLVMDMTTYRGVTEAHIGRVVLPLARAVNVHCRTPSALERFKARQAVRFGVDSDSYRRGVVQAEEAQPLVVEPPELDLPRLEVDTTAGYAPGLDDLLTFVINHASGRAWALRHVQSSPT